MRSFCLPAALLCALAASARAGGTIELIPDGAVDVRSGPAASWQPVTGRQAVAAGQEVRTHDSATARLVFSDGSLVRIGNSAIFTIDKTDRDETRFSLKLGKIRAAFAGLLSSRVSIRTPSAVCAVRGTVFEMGADEKGTSVTMAEGVLEVKDNKGKQAVVTSEETLKIDENGLGRPRLLALSDERALPAVRPYAVHQEMARDATRKMLEDMRNRELKANEAQLGKDVVDAFGRRVRLEEYLLRPDTKSFEVLFLNRRKDRFDWGHIVESFNAAIPDDLSRVPAIISGSILSASQPSNWLKNFEFYATNTVDAEKETIAFTAPVPISFSGFGKGQLWYPASIDWTQTLYGPGVPGGARVEFSQHQDWNASVPSQFTWWQKVQATPGMDDLQTMFIASLDPTNAADVAAGYSNLTTDPVLYPNTNTTTLYPSGPTKADFQQSTHYPDNSSLTVEKFLVSNDGKILDFANPTAGAFANNGDYNLEINIKSSLFQGRAIDVLIAPEILKQKSAETATGSGIR